MANLTKPLARSAMSRALAAPSAWAVLVPWPGLVLAGAAIGLALSAFGGRKRARLGLGRLGRLLHTDDFLKPTLVMLIMISASCSLSLHT